MREKIISVAHDKGGVGKTTIATNIIVQLLQQHKSIDVIDLDPKKHLTRFLARRQDPRIKLFEFNGIKELRKLFDNNKGILIIDVGGLDSDQTRNAIAYSDVVITPLSDSQIELDGLMEFKKVIRSLQAARADLRATILLNRIHPNTNKTIEQLKEFIQQQPEVFKVFDTVVRDRAAYKNAYGEGKGVGEIGGADKAAEEIFNLVKEL
ncbi:MAG: AAA family ATPase [Sulfurimonas sp.]